MTSHRLTSSSSQDLGLQTTWSDAKSSFFHSIWLRDNCRCDSCGNPAIGRRTLRLTSLDLGVQVERSAVEAGALHVEWSDGHKSQYAGEWLREHAYDETARRGRAFTPKLWDANYIQNPGSLAWEAVSSSEAGFYEMLERIRDYGFCFIQGSPAHDGTIAALASRIGPLQESNFGKVVDLQVDYTSAALLTMCMP